MCKLLTILTIFRTYSHTLNFLNPEKLAIEIRLSNLQFHAKLLSIIFGHKEEQIARILNRCPWLNQPILQPRREFDRFRLIGNSS